MTDSANEAIRALLEAPEIPDGAGLRIYAEPVDQDRASVALAITEGPAGTDQVVEEEGARVFLDPQAALYLDDKVLDAQVEGDQVRFSIGEQGT